MKNASTLSALLLSAGFLAACGGGDADDPGREKSIQATTTETADAVPARFWSDTPLEGAKDVKDIRDAEAFPETVVVRGTLQDFGELATFKLVEDSLEDCTEMGPEDHCTTPWDYCCEEPDKLARYTINVELLEDGDMPGPWKLRGFKGLDRLSEVMVSGKLIVDEAGNMRIAADKIAMQ